MISFLFFLCYTKTVTEGTQQKEGDSPLNRALGSKVDLRNFNIDFARLYWECVGDIMDNEKIQKLDQWEQHNHTSRLQHSLNVSYYSFLICLKLGWDYRSAARAGLLHDLYFYDWRTKKGLRKNHALWHPLVAADNAKKICDLNPVEEDCIIKHMWPCTFVPPRYKEGFVITFVDKICATCEVFAKDEPKVARAQ